MITRKIGRRDFLKMTGTTLAGAALFGNARRSFAETASDSKMWKQFSGTTLNFISENTPPSSAIAANTSPFTDLTGIKLNIAQMELGSVVQKVALDFGSGQSAYQVIYADPYQALAPFYKGFVDLKTFLTDENLPKVPGGIEDFIPTQLDADGKFENPDAVEHAEEAVDPETGASLSFVTAYDQFNRKITNRFDTCYGFGNAYSDQGAVAVAGA